MKKNIPSDNESLKLEIKELREKLRIIEEKYDLLANSLKPAAQKSVSVPEENITTYNKSISAMDNPPAERDFAMREEKLQDGSENSIVHREMERFPDNWQDGSVNSSMDRKIETRKENLQDVPVSSKAGRDLAGRNDNLQDGTDNPKVKSLTQWQNGLTRPGNENSLSEEQNQEKEQSKSLSEGVLKFAKAWKSLPWKERQKRAYKRTYTEIIKDYPSLSLPGTVKIQKEIRQYGLPAVLLSQKLSDLIESRLKKKYSSDSFALKASRVLEFLNKTGMSTRADLTFGAKLSGGTLDKTIKTLKALRLIISIKRDRCNKYYLITEEGKKLIEELSGSKAAP